MNIQTLQTNNQKRMTSQQIADLVEKRHDNVKRTIELVVKAGVIVQPQSEDEYSQDAMGRPRTTQVYVFTGNQGERDSLVVVAQLSPEFTGALIDRWRELEAQASAPVIPATLSEALRLAADQAELIEHQQSRLALVEPKAAALDVIDSSIGSINVRDTAKTLGIPQNKFVNWCIAHDWMYRDNRNKLKMSSIRMKQGFMEERAVTYQGNSNERVATTQPLFTPKGLTRLAYVFAIVHEVA